VETKTIIMGADGKPLNLGQIKEAALAEGF